jgi:hypothetical protein
VAVAVTVTV